MTLYKAIREILFGHDCWDYLEHKSIQFTNEDPKATPNPLSIYGPEGSYRLDLHHCTRCNTYSGQRYDTYGGSSVAPETAKRAWEEHKRLLTGTKEREEALV